MTSLVCGILKEIIQMNLLTKQKETQDLENELMVMGGDGRPTGTYCAVQGALLSVTWQPGGEGGLGEVGCMYMYG